MTRKERPHDAQSPFSVRAEKPRTALADAMKEMRTWLDNTRLQPAEFKIEASQFEQAFA